MPYHLTESDLCQSRLPNPGNCQKVSQQDFPHGLVISLSIGVYFA
jgi:hypothetical protein